MRHLRWLMAICALFAVAACGSPTATGSSPSQSATASPGETTPGRIAAPTVKITRTGGIAGVNQSIEIIFDGSWTYTDAKTATTETGTLTAAQRAQLLQLVSDPAFLAEMAAAPNPVACADGFTYTVQVGQQSSSMVDCGAGGKDKTAAVLALLADVTPL